MNTDGTFEILPHIHPFIESTFVNHYLWIWMRCTNI